MGLINYLKEKVQKEVGSLANELAQEVRRKVGSEVRRVKNAFIRAGLFVILLGIGVVFISLAASYFFIDYIQLGRTISFLIVGLVILLIGIIVKLIK